jgi:3-oxoacyl-[acyl-carrier protein] reductase
VWARELAKHKIRVGAVAPGAVETEMLANLKPEAMAALKSMIPLGRLATPDEIWMAVRFVIECGYFTGRVLDVDGGLQL